MSKNEVADTWKRLAAQFRKEGNNRWAEYCELNAEVWSL